MQILMEVEPVKTEKRLDPGGPCGDRFEGLDLLTPTTRGAKTASWIRYKRAALKTSDLPVRLVVARILGASPCDKACV